MITPRLKLFHVEQSWREARKCQKPGCITLQQFPEPAIKVPTPKYADFLWFLLMSTWYDEIGCCLASTKQQRRPASNIWNGCPIPTIHHIYNFWYQIFSWAKKEKYQHSQTSVYHFPLANCRHTLIISVLVSLSFFFLCLLISSIICCRETHSLCFCSWSILQFPSKKLRNFAKAKS